MPPRILRGAMCVQRFDDSLNSAIHTTYRVSLRSSSMLEPRDPLLKVLTVRLEHSEVSSGPKREADTAGGRAHGGAAPPKQRYKFTKGCEINSGNDPSAGSPTETLLRLLLPLNDRVRITFRSRVEVALYPRTSPKASLSHSIGSSDGRCVQRAGT